MKKPRPFVATTARRIADRYLQRFTTTAHHFRRILEQHAKRSLAVHGGDPTEIAAWIDEEVAHRMKLGHIDDDRYAVQKARAMLRRGSSPRRIRAVLSAKGASAASIQHALDCLQTEYPSPDRQAARTWARKRRVGPWATRPRTEDERRRDLAKCVRAGFPYALARDVLSGPVDDTVEPFDAR